MKLKIQPLTFFLLFILFTLTTKVSGQNSFYDLVVTDIQGEPFDLAQLKGKKVLVVNTASKCGFTPQYEDLEKLYEEYRGTGFEIIAFPANNFAGQEPGTNEEIASFCKKNYGVTFPVMSKISVKGQDQDPVYQWLTNKEKNGVEDSEVRWNFQKYMIDEHGRLVGMIPPRKNPYCKEIIHWLEQN